MAGPLRGGGGIKDILLKTTCQNISTGNVGKVVVFQQVCSNIWQKIWLF